MNKYQDKNMNRYQLLLVNDLIREEKYDLAIQKLIKLCEDNPENYIFKQELAKLLRSQKNNELAKQYLDELLDTDNKNYALLELGTIELDEGNIEKAIDCFESLLNMENCLPDDEALALIELGNIQITINNLGAAKILFEKVKRIKNCKPKHRDYAKYKLALIELLQGDFDIAKIHFKEILSSEYQTESLVGLIKIAVVQNDYIEGLRLLDKIDNNLFFMKCYQFYFKNKLGMIKDMDNINGYLCNQLANYNEEEAIKQIMLHLDEKDDKKVYSIFNSNMDINNLFEEAKKNIKNVKSFHNGISNTYVVDFGYTIGFWHSYPTSLVKVVTVYGTKNIITMYPDIDEKNIKKSKYKQKRLTTSKVYV